MSCKNQCTNCKRRDPIAEQMAAAHKYFEPNGEHDIENNVLRVDVEIPSKRRSAISIAQIRAGLTPELKEIE